MFENQSQVRPFEEVYISDASWAHGSTDGVVRHRSGDLKDSIAGPPDPNAEVRVLSINVKVLIEDADFVEEASSNQYMAEIVDLKRFVGDVRVLQALSNSRIVAR